MAVQSCVDESAVACHVATSVERPSLCEVAALEVEDVGQDTEVLTHPVLKVDVVSDVEDPCSPRCLERVRSVVQGQSVLHGHRPSDVPDLVSSHGDQNGRTLPIGQVWVECRGRADHDLVALAIGVGRGRTAGELHPIGLVAVAQSVHRALGHAKDAGHPQQVRHVGVVDPVVSEPLGQPR